MQKNQVRILLFTGLLQKCSHYLIFLVCSNVELILLHRSILFYHFIFKKYTDDVLNALTYYNLYFYEIDHSDY
jgi:hypothetical protein